MQSYSLQRSITAASMQDAQRKIGAVMGICLGMWFAPVISGPAINVTEHEMVRHILRTVGADASENNVEALFWFLRKKMLLLNGVTYIPFAGTAFQLIEVYALGQFVLHCVESGMSLSDERQMKTRWREIQGDLFTGHKVVRSYRQFTGTPFPAAIESDFVRIVDKVGQFYRGLSRVPGVEPTQEVVGEGIRQTVNILRKGLKKIGQEAKKRL